MNKRGFTLIFVLFAVMLLTLLGTAFFASTTRARGTATEVSSQQMAVARAEMAVQRAILDIRSGVAVPVGLVARPAPDGIAGCGGLNCLVRAKDNGKTLGLMQGGGLQWDYIIYKSDQLLGTAPNRYTIQANGYYGFSATGAVFNAARIEVEIDVGSANGGSTDIQGNTASGGL
jgi:type II secretory pathway pseudopilin PulG